MPQPKFQLTPGLLDPRANPPSEIDPVAEAEAEGLLTTLPKKESAEIDTSLEGVLTRRGLQWNSQTGQLEPVPPRPEIPTADPTTSAAADSHVLPPDLTRDPLVDERVGAEVRILQDRQSDIRRNEAFLKRDWSYEGHQGFNADRAREMAQKEEPVHGYFEGDESVGELYKAKQPYRGRAPETSVKALNATKEVLNFVFSDDMALLGMKWDERGFTWGVDNVKEQLTEHPYVSALTVASWMFPIGASWIRGARIAKRAEQIAAEGGVLLARRAAPELVETTRRAGTAAPEVAAEYIPPGSTGTVLRQKPYVPEPAGLLGPGDNAIRLGKGKELTRAPESRITSDIRVEEPPTLGRTTLRILKDKEPIIAPSPAGPAGILAPQAGPSTAMGLGGEVASEFTFGAPGRGLFGTKLMYRFDDHANLVKNLAYGKYSGIREMFGEGRVAAIKRASTPEEISQIISPKELRKMLLADHHEYAALELRKRAIKGQLNSPVEKVRWWMQERFYNNYTLGLTSMSAVNIRNVHKVFADNKFAEWLEKAPSFTPEQEKLWLGYYHGKVARADLEKKIGADGMNWVDGYREKAKNLFQAQYDEGMIDEDTYRLFMDPDKVGTEFHMPALKKSTPGADALDIGVEKAMGLSGRGERLKILTEEGVDLGRFFTPPTMKQRTKFITADEVMLHADELITDPTSILRGGLIRDTLMTDVHRGARDIIMGAMKEPLLHGHRVANAAELAAMPAKFRAKHWVEFDKLNEVAPGLADRMRRMIKKGFEKEGKQIADSDIPMAIDRNLVEALFGRSPNSAAGSVSMFGRLFELLTAVHKTSLTSLNPATHSGNLIGNFAFLSMAGYNPFSGQALKDGRMITDIFVKAARDYTAATAAAKKAGKSIEGAVFDRETLIKYLKPEQRFMTDNYGGQIDLADFLSSDQVRGLIEEQGFQSVEGFQRVHQILRGIEKAEQGGWKPGSSAVKYVARLFAAGGETPGFKQILENASAAYLGEDMIPKMMYAVHLARKGWGKDAIVREVGRRLPQYQSVGELAKEGRKVVLPWITFPAEAARILKNNVQDNPMAMFTWLRAPDIAQGIVSGAGFGPTYAEYQDAMKTLPPWAQKWSTLLVNENISEALAGGMAAGTAGLVAGGLAGGLPGAIAAGATGAAVGAAAPAPTMGGIAGAAVGALMGGGMLGAAAGGVVGLSAGAAMDAYKSKEQKAEEARQLENTNVRAFMMDFIPHLALAPSSTSEYQLAKANPFSDEPKTGIEWFRTSLDLLPVTPFAVGMPLLELYSGRGSFGEEIQGKGAGNYFAKTALGLMGFVSPPMMQKYGMKINGPEGNPIDLADIHERNGGLMSHPKGITATFFGIAAAGLTALGGRRLQALKGITNLSTAGVAGLAAGAGLFGGTAGYAVNSTRLFSDLGIIEDPSSKRKGNHSLDFLARNFFGVSKSFPGSEQNRVRAERERFVAFEDIRKMYGKDMYAAVARNDIPSALRIATEVRNSFMHEYGNVPEADLRFREYMKGIQEGMPKSPEFRTISDEELMIMIEASKAAGDEKNKFQEQYVRALQAELTKRKMMNFQGLSIVDQELPKL